MARTGGTLISRCLGTMSSVAFFSEETARGGYKVTEQAWKWFDLMSEFEYKSIDLSLQENFVEAVSLIEKRCKDRNLNPVLRDWTHLDYMGVPYGQPTYRLSMAESLQGRFDVIQVATVRHPVDQYLSLSKLPGMEGNLTLELFVKGYLEFARRAVKMPLFRYEDFLQNQMEMMSDICGRLEVDFDDSFQLTWPDYTKITGDNVKNSGTQVRKKKRQHDPTLLEQMSSIEGYDEALELLGYRHPG